MFPIPGLKDVKSFPDEYKFMYTSILYQHCCNNVCGGWGSYEINLKELTIPKHYLLSVVPWCLTTWLGHPGNHGISNTPAITTIWFVSHPKVKSFPDEYKFMYTSILYCWCVGNSVISQVAQPGGEAPHLEDKKIMFGNNQLLQVDFIRPSSTTCFPSQG